MAFGLLGPLSVAGEGGEIRLSGFRRRVLLVRLLVSANEVVPASHLIEDLWDDAPPAGGASTLHSHVSALRKVLGAERLQRRDGGYLVVVADGELDTKLFASETASAQQAISDGDEAKAIGLWSRALGRWRGQALADVTGMGWAVGEATRLDEQRSVALEGWLRARLDLGDHAGVASDAERAVVEHPLREGLWATLMLALYRSGRQSDALRAYRRLSRVLGDELGIAPSPELARLEEAILLHRPEVQSNDPAGMKPSRDEIDVRRPTLPTGTVTLLSMQIDEADGATADLVRSATADRGGVEVVGEGDDLLFAFNGAGSAMTAAIAGQASLLTREGSGAGPAPVRMGLHTGEASTDDAGYATVAVSQAARLAHAAHAGQICVSQATVAAIGSAIPHGISVRDLGLFRLPEFDAPVRVSQLCHADLLREFPPPRARPAAVGNLPVAVSSFVGRADELSCVDELLRGHRLVTLTGAGGTGKTRLAMEAVAAWGDRFVEGVWLLDLAAVRDPANVVAVVADTLGVRQQASRSVTDVLTDWVKDQNLLLVFDNCEHVLQTAAPLVAQLLESGPNVHVLATSREPLRIEDETVWEVPPLGLPDSSIDADVDTLLHSDAVRLFIDRASAVEQNLPLGEVDLRAIAQIVVQLDGLPLAIELAAARVTALSAQDIAARLHDRFRLLIEGSRTALPRHQTLLAAIEWSYQLLPEQQQATLCRLSVFAGSFTLDGAQAVATAGPTSASEVSGLVLALAAKSLLRIVTPSASSAPDPAERTPGVGGPRFRLLETIRQYAADELEQTDDGEAAQQARSRHADYYVDLAREAEPELYREHQGRWLRMLELEHDNIRVALGRLAADDVRTGDLMQLVAALRRFWHTHNHLPECVSYLEPALAKPGGNVPETVRAAALNLASEVVRYSDLATAERYGEEALILARRHGDNTTASRCLSKALAFVARFRGDDETAIALAEEALDVARQSGDLVVLGEALVASSLVAQDNLTLGRQLSEEAIRTAERSGDVGNAAYAHSNIGCTLLALGEVTSARAHIDQAVTLFAELDSENSMAMVNLGWACLQQDEVATARTTFARAMRVARQGYLRNETAYAALGAAICAGRTAQPASAAALHAFADTELRAIGQRWSEPERSYREEDLSRLRDALGDGFDCAYDIGTGMSRADLMQLAVKTALDAEDMARAAEPAQGAAN